MNSIIMKWLTQWLHPQNMQWLYLNSRWVFGSCMLLIIPGLVGAWLVPADYQQGEAFRIIFCHVPASILSLFCYSILAFSSLVFLIWRIRYYDFIAYCAQLLRHCGTTLRNSAVKNWLLRGEGRCGPSAARERFRAGWQAISSPYNVLRLCHFA